MATLGSLLSTRSQLTEGAVETNMMKGRIWGYTPQNHSEFSAARAPHLNFYFKYIAVNVCYLTTKKLSAAS